MAAPLGNRNAAKAKMFEGQIRAALNAEDRLALREIADKLVAMARTGDLPAIKEVIDRVDGKPKQGVELSGDSDNPLTLAIATAADLRKQIRGGE